MPRPVKFKPDGERPRRPLTPRQRWTFRVIALLLPLLALAMLEVFLRVAGHGHPVEFFLRQRVNGRDVLVENRHFGERFFPPGLARTPQPVMFPARKEPGVTRLFVLGESAAMGDPEPAFGLPRMLQAMLELKFPSNRFEVINVAMTAINSHVIREIARDCAPLEGDFWLIYMGNNEVVGPFGAGTIFGRQTPSLGFIRTSLWLKKFRVVQLLSSLRARGPTEWGGMEMFLQQQVARNDPRMEKVLWAFQNNLNDIIALGTNAGAKVMIGAPVVNLRDCPPFASRHDLKLSDAEEKEFAAQLARGTALNDAGDHRSAHQVLSALLHAHTKELLCGCADLYFQMARCQLALGSNGFARRNFSRALGNDTLRFRATGEMKEIVREKMVWPKTGKPLVNTEEAFTAASSNGIPGSEFFYEHVHFTFEGTHLLARTFLDEVVKALPPSVVARGRAGVPSVEDCARRLAWTDWEKREVFSEIRQRLRQPPFTAQYGHAARDAEWGRRIGELSAGLTREKILRLADDYAAALQAWPQDWVLRENFAAFLEANGEAARALEQWREVARLLPHDPQAYFRAGNLLDTLGAGAEAVPLFREALRLDPRSGETRNSLALALSSLGKTAEAAREWELALRLKPKFAEARVNLGQLCAQQGRTNEARAHYERALRDDTNSTAAHISLGKLLGQAGDTRGAAAHYEAALRINPAHPVAHYNLGNARRAENSPQAAEHYAAAVRARPEFGEAHLALGLELARGGRTAEAHASFVEAARLLPDSADASFNLGVSFAKQGKFPEAAREFGAVLKLNPNHPRAREMLEKAERMK